MFLSIIVPMYKVEQYIEKCIASFFVQDIPVNEYEIIAVNDGSPDGSLEIANRVAAKHENLVVISRENGGLSAARNTGLMHAKGEYVWFVDADDWIEPNCLAKLLNFAKSNHLDVYCFGYQLVFENGQIQKCSIPSVNNKIYEGKNFICDVKVPPAACFALYRRDFLVKNHLYFMEGILHEDQEFTPRAYYLANRISYTDYVVYDYLQRQGGITKSNNSVKRSKDLLSVADSLYSFTQKNILRDTRSYYEFQNLVSFAFSQSLAFYNKDSFSLNEYKNKPYYPLNINNQLSIGFKWKYKLMNYSLKLYLSVYKFLKR